MPSIRNKDIITIRSFVLAIAALWAMVAAGVWAAVPEYRGPVNDYGGVLDSDAKSRLESKILAYRQQSGNEIGVLIVKSIDGADIADFAHDVLKAWGIGKKGKDNGVLLVVALQERRARVEVGYGLEADLTDVECGRLISKSSPMAEHFRRGDYAGGIDGAIDGIIVGIGGEYKNADGDKPERDPRGFPLIAFGAIGLFLAIMRRMRRYRSWNSGSFGGPFIGGGLFGGGGSSGGGGGFSFGGGSSGGGGASGGW